MNVIAVFDVGKTNKKVFLFSERYDIVWERTTSLPEITDEDGDPCENLTRLTDWLHESMQEIMALPGFTIRAVNFSGYGASLVYLDGDGKPVGHLYNYLKEFPDAVRNRFYEQYGPVDALLVQTASPALDSLNSGLMLYRIKYDKPDLFARIQYALHLPQYLSYCLTGQVFSDLTSIGCHTMLWDFPQQRYHDWVGQEGLLPLLAPVHAADQPVPVWLDNAPDSIPAGVGLHDSSAALIPYLASFQNEPPFVLISTGTWCISLNPFNSEPLTHEELQYDCLCYLTYRGEPVKASRLFAGHDHEQQIYRLAEHFNVPVDAYKRVHYDAELIRQLTPTGPPDNAVPTRMEPAHLLQPSRFGNRDLSRYATYDLAYHQLILDIMDQQVVSTALVLPGVDSPGEASPGLDSSDASTAAVSRICVDGGFSRNSIYMNLLAAAFPTMEVWAASVAQATALGAALAIHDHWNLQPIPSTLISLTRYPSQPVP